ncbi:hypothetical protein CampHawk_212 [Bacillus phage CampHawk]|uniref:Uncharacterized protein n=1 Tax=Bacillus phage CampHawk TaxID=1406783 RepID=U5PT27_9CAUD|nr:hypothetical protein CampHawk_11 [Bacillus phage CampHawk]YP_008770146.1 hypothetical protein CampHawk_212 [Bacillus phage CampHawk]UAV84281.1 hypothetical protein phi18_011 [Bacillus phage phi18]AGY46889.1 hypothetical protein CampHawk_11 [Bacillus phage CampHawk]AGY47090.1 hypothetical protein CampHawk_212 [Bacillus phage CampHawk]UAV84478.1 hypothetical protein phi18_208 [Bacillus phage phi18]
MRKFVTTLTASPRNKKVGNHRLEISPFVSLRRYYYFNTAICIENPVTREFAIDDSYGSLSTNQNCAQYRQYFSLEGYKEVSLEEIHAV